MAGIQSFPELMQVVRDKKEGVLFVRHSTRDKFPKGMPKDEENAQLLNAAGVELAHKCGEQLRDVGVAVKKVF